MQVNDCTHTISPAHQVVYKFRITTWIWPQKTHYKGFKDEQIHNLLKPYTAKMEKED